MFVELSRNHKSFDSRLLTFNFFQLNKLLLKYFKILYSTDKNLMDLFKSQFVVLKKFSKILIITNNLFIILIDNIPETNFENKQNFLNKDIKIS